MQLRRAVLALVMLVVGGCGSHTPAVSLGRQLDAACAQRGLAAAPMPGEEGVYRAGPLTLAIGEDLAQASDGAPGGTEAIAVVRGDRPVTATVQADTPATLALQFGAPLTPQAAATGDHRIRFPICRGTVRRFGGGILFSGAGCARLRVTQPGAQPADLLIPVANSLKGCRASHARPAVAALPCLGVACGRPDWIGCHRLGIGATVYGTTQGVVRLAGHVATLTPLRPGATGWLGYLRSADYRHGALAIPIAHTATHWDGSAEVLPATSPSRTRVPRLTGEPAALLTGAG